MWIVAAWGVCHVCLSLSAWKSHQRISPQTGSSTYYPYNIKMLKRISGELALSLNRNVIVTIRFGNVAVVTYTLFIRYRSGTITSIFYPYCETKRTNEIQSRTCQHWWHSSLSYQNIYDFIYTYIPLLLKL